VRGIDAFNLCIGAQDQYARIYELYCVSLVLICFRLFYVFRYIAGLHKISSTLSASAPDLARVFVVWMGLLFMFTVSGCMIFGRDVFGMRTFWRALSFLMTTLASGNLDNDTYKVMLDSQGYITDVYLVTLFLTFWLVLLNLVTSIISNAFFVTDSHAASFNPEGWEELLSTYVFFNNNDLYGVDRIARSRGEFIDTLPPAQRIASRGLRRLLPFGQRVPVLLGLRRWRKATYVALLESAARKARVRSQAFVTYSQAVKLIEPFEHMLCASQLSGALMIAAMFGFVLRKDAPVLQINGNCENLTQMHASVDGITRLVESLAYDLARYRDACGLLSDDGSASSYAGGSRRSSTTFRFGVSPPQVPATPSNPGSGLPPLGLRARRPRGCSVSRAEANPSLVQPRRTSWGWRGTPWL
jgi:hypothetical protein